MKKVRADFSSTIFAACALAFSSLGDAFLYPFLPLSFHSVGVPAVAVGLLLSINRFVRIVFNTIIVHAFAQFGLRAVMIVAVVVAILSTFGYSIASGIMTWICLRVLWGLSFSAMRIGTIGYALMQGRQGIALGVSRSIQEIGPMIALLLAPFFLSYFSTRTIFCLLGMLSLPAIYFACSLPVSSTKVVLPASKPRFKAPSTLNSVTFISAIVVDGVVVVTLGVLFLHDQHGIDLIAATAIAAFFLAYRRICLVVFSPVGGWVADQFGLQNVFKISMIFVVGGLVVMVSGWIAVGVVIVFTFYSVGSALTPASASHGEADALMAVAENATWRDLGAAIGTLVGGFLITSNYLHLLLVIAILIMSLLLVFHVVVTGRWNKFLFQWK